MRSTPPAPFLVALFSLSSVAVMAQTNARNVATTEGCVRASLGMFIVLIIAVMFLTSRVARQRRSRRPPPV